MDWAIWIIVALLWIVVIQLRVISDRISNNGIHLSILQDKLDSLMKVTAEARRDS